MVTVKLHDGLGNQMFQYAMGRALAQRRGTSLALDVSSFYPGAFRQYSLGVFNIAERLTSGGLMGFGRLRTLCSRVWLPGLPHVLIERGFGFDPSALDAPGNVYLIGYWLSEKYFKEIEETIRREFSFKAQPDEWNAEMARCIRGVNAVAVHVRRSDYVTDPVNNQMLGTCPPEYYREGARLIGSRVPGPHFFVFSDEPEWARANLELGGPTTFVDGNRLEKGYEDLRLLTLCRHHLIANSTFSWWGAWLADSGGIVVAPKKWFNEDQFDARDIVPDAWMRL
jgi:glycosyl transferase family 11